MDLYRLDKIAFDTFSTERFPTTRSHHCFFEKLMAKTALEFRRKVIRLIESKLCCIKLL
jgi:hypothetical protein